MGRSLDEGEDRMNAFAAMSEDKMVMQPFDFEHYYYTSAVNSNQRATQQTLQKNLFPKNSAQIIFKQMKQTH